MRTSPAPLRTLRAILGLALPLCLGACAGPAGCSSGAPADAGVVAEDLSPLPAPAGLLADLFLPTPEATWTKARGVVGGPAAFLPQSFGALAVTLLKLPITVAAEIDGGVPVVGAAIKKGTDPALAAIGLHVKAGDRFLDQLTKGPDARFVARQDPASHIRMITPAGDGGAAGEPVVMGVLGNYLLLAREIESLAAVGPYVARTLGAAAATKDDVTLQIPESALSGPILSGVRTQWGTTKETLDRAGAPVLPIAGTMDLLLAVLGDSKHAELGLQIDAATVHARFTMTPKAGGGPASKAIAEMTIGDVQPLYDLPASSLVGMMWREAAATRAAAIPAQAESLGRMLGKDAPAEDKEAILAALRAEDEARGDWVALGIGLDSTGPNAMVRAPLRDGDRMGKSLKALVELGNRASVKAKLRESALGISAGKAVIENLAGEVQRVRFERIEPKDAKEPKEEKTRDKKTPKPEPSPPGSVPSSIDLFYLLTKDTLFGAAGYDPKEALKTIVKAPEGGSLGATPAIKAALDPLGAESSFALVMDPIRLVAARAGKSAPPDPSPVVIALGKTADPPAMWGRVDVAATAIQELVKHRGAF